MSKKANKPSFVEESLMRKLERAELENEKLREALAFYADRETWKGEFPNRPIDSDVDGDFKAVFGLRARLTLKSLREPQ